LQSTRIDISRTALTSLVADMGQILREGDVPANRRLMRAFIVRIEATKKGGVLYYTLPFASNSGAIGALRGPPSAGV